MNRTVLLGLDGATFTVLDSLMDRGIMPHLKNFISRGVRGVLRSTPNALTAPAWTSLVTGRSPGNHGIFDFVRVEQFDERPNYRLATSSDIQCETIWSIVSRHDLRLITLNFPVMFPPQPVAGFMIPGFVPERHLRRSVYPPELFERLKALPDLEIKELTVNFEEERRSVQVLAEEQYEQWIRYHIWRERQWFKVLKHLMQKEPWNLAGIVFDGIDKLQHACWRFLDPALSSSSPTSWERKIGDLCLDYFRELDGFLGEIVTLAGSEATIVVASDHGFGATEQIFYVNVWLSQNGLLKWAEGVSYDEEGMLNAEGVKNAAFLFDWSETNAYTLTAGSNGIYIRTAKTPDQPGIPPEKYQATREQIINSLLKITNPVTGQRVIKEALTREKAFPGQHTQLAPDITLVLSDYGFVSVLRADAAVKPRKTIAGTHHPDGIFLAAGPGIRQGENISTLSILDIAPLLLYRLGLPLPAELEGRLPENIFHSEVLKAAPVRTEDVSQSRPEPKAGGENTLDAEGEKIILEKLRALGYLD